MSLILLFRGRCLKGTAQWVWSGIMWASWERGQRLADWCKIPPSDMMSSATCLQYKAGDLHSTSLHNLCRSNRPIILKSRTVLCCLKFTWYILTLPLCTTSFALSCFIKNRAANCKVLSESWTPIQCPEFMKMPLKYVALISTVFKGLRLVVSRNLQICTLGKWSYFIPISWYAKITL